MNIGKRIRRVRQLEGLTQGELVEGIASITYLSKIENEQIQPTTSFLEAIAPRLGVSKETLTGENRETDQKKLQQIINAYKGRKKKLTEKELNFLLFHTSEYHESHIMLGIYGVLLRYFSTVELFEKAEQIYSLAKLYPSIVIESSYSYDLFYFYISCGNYLYAKQSFLEADRFYERAEAIAALVTKSIEAADLYYCLSLTKQRLLPDKRISLYYSEKAYELYLDCADYHKAHRSLITIGVQYHLLGEFEKSIACLEQAEEYFVKENNLEMLAMIEYNLGRVCQGKKDYKTAIRHFEKSITMNDQLKIDKEKLYSYRSLIQIHLEQNDFSGAEQHFKEAEQLLNRLNLPYLRQEFNALSAQLPKRKGDEAGYEKKIQKIINRCIEEGHVLLAKNLSEELGDHYSMKGNYKKSTYYYRISLDKEGDRS